jgi:23S rRNA (uracil1939-C5)-methyltransferase
MTKTVAFEKIVGGGKALGYLDGKPCFAAGPLPGEVAEVEIIKDKPSFIEAAVKTYTTASNRRSGEAEAHYLACSPWQNVDYDYQLELKLAVLRDAFSRPELQVPVLKMTPAPAQLGYRNKLEFSVKRGEHELDLAFHDRGSYENLISLPEGCRLGSTAMNLAALKLARAAHELKLDGYIETITIRRSELDGSLLGHIALHQVPQRDFSALALPELASVVITRLRGRTTHEVLWNTGSLELTERIGGNDLAYSFDGFFQTNVTLFESVLTAILAAVKPGGKLVDLYGGVGTIGLAAAKLCDEVIGIEIDEKAVKRANENAQRAKITNYRSVQSPAARLDASLLEDAGTIVVDPPRAGLEPGVVQAILKAAPKRIIYLSCNPTTQARDASLLSASYTSAGVAGYDLYPGTLHLESLMVFDRI